MNGTPNKGKAAMKLILGVITIIALVPVTFSVQPFLNDSFEKASIKLLHGYNISFRMSRNTFTQIDALDSTERKAQLPPQLKIYNDRLYNGVHYSIDKSNQGNTNSYDERADPSSYSAYIERVELQESQVSTTNRQKLLLHRQKRYLLFPEGSSFQLVFDLIIPIVDYTNFAIMGITCAVAWELPSKPPSEIIDNFRHKLRDGTFGLSRRNDSVGQQLQYIKDNNAADTRIGNDELQQLQPLRNSYYDNVMQQLAIKAPASGQQPSDDKRQSNSWYGFASGERPFYRNSHKWQSQNWVASKPSSSWGADNWWDRNKNRIQNQWQKKQWKWQPYGNSQRQSRNRKIVRKPPKHRIYPVFGRRRRRSLLNLAKQGNGNLENKLHGIHTKQHIESRHRLFSKIEKIYKSRGHNGTACVMRTLCETYKKRYRRNRHPYDFIMELLRAIFTLPEDSLASQFPQSPYSSVMLHAPKVQSCSQHYDGCDLPIWHE